MAITIDSNSSPYYLSGSPGSSKNYESLIFSAKTDHELVIENDFAGFVKVDFGRDYWADDVIRIEAPILEFVSGSNGDMTAVFESGGRVTVTDFALSNFTPMVEINLGAYTESGWSYLDGMYVDVFHDATMIGEAGADQQDQWGNLWEFLQPTTMIGLAGNDEVGTSEIPGGLVSGDAGDDNVRVSAGSSLALGGSGDDLINSDAANPLVASGGTGSDIYMLDMDVLAMYDYNNYRDGFEPSNDSWITTIHDVGGARDTIFFEQTFPGMNGVSGDEAVWKSAGTLIANTNAASDSNGGYENPFGYDLQTSVFIDDGDLTFRAYSGENEPVFLPTRETAFWWWRAQGYEEEEGSGEFEYNMTPEERRIFNINDISTYPGFSDLNQSAKQWLTEVWNPADPASFEALINGLAQKAHQVLPRGDDYDNSQPIFRVPAEGYSDALANTSFDILDWTTYPVLPFSNILATTDEFYAGFAYSNGMIRSDQMGTGTVGFTIENFVYSNDTVEGIVVATEASASLGKGTDPLEDYLLSIYKPGGSFADVIAKTITYGESLGLLQFVGLSQDGIEVGAGADEGFLLVANYNLDVDRLAAAPYWKLDASGAVSLTTSSASGNGLLSADWVSGSDLLVAGGAGDDILIGGGHDMPDYGWSVSDDVMFGGAGNDWFEAGEGVNRLFGGGGSDVFIVDNGYQYTTIVGGDMAESNIGWNTVGNHSEMMPVLETLADTADDYVYVDWN
ncbi:hypothetical protein N9L30_08875, partial [Burkholderiaceae bacterium]|nr:hypothetical protein [Burkholderiaceae bacterium]